MIIAIRLDGGSGLPLFAPTWSATDMPSGLQLAGLQRRRSASTLPPVLGRIASSRDGKGARAEVPLADAAKGDQRRYARTSHEARQTRVVREHGRRMGTPFGGSSPMTAWPTPTAANADGSQEAKNVTSTGKREDGSKATCPWA